MSSLKQKSIFECFVLPRPVIVQPATPPVLDDSRPAKKAKNEHEPRAFAHARWMAIFTMLAFAYGSVHVIAVQSWVLRACSWPGHEHYGPDCWPRGQLANNPSVIGFDHPLIYKSKTLHNFGVSWIAVYMLTAVLYDAPLHTFAGDSVNADLINLWMQPGPAEKKPRDYQKDDANRK
jgi:hypothetical protein